jgi:hypothetical protein
MKIDWLRKLTSRKLWLSVASFVSMLIIYFTGSESDAQQISALIIAGATVLGYVLAEGLADSSNNSVELIEAVEVIKDEE